ncbi:twin-arginine translocation signal domain-containing protein [Jiangella gansuensis]|uniref:twin-arginine translocation signal domain-containing protein n=1 Tax=Jiangella gansuensis TaxID=281473 RepID=UPI0012FC497F|nr:twin-arginine translocation signal domain-containing protein [Jiangella gansuensis]
MTRRTTRRAFLAGGLAAAAVAACGTEPQTQPRTIRTPDPAPKLPAGPVPEPPLPVPDLSATQPWEPSAGEIAPEIKVAAVRVIEALGNAPDGAAPPTQRLTAAGAEPRLAAAAGPLVPPSVPSTVAVVYPQYGGLERSTASVMAVTEQTWVVDRALVSRSVTVDVRLKRGSAGWLVDQLLPAEVIDRAALTLDGAAAQLAASPRVHLPDAAVADLAAGIVDARVVASLLELAATYELSVSVFRAGHPENVFGTDRTSNHTRGRAVDIWAVDGVPVVTMGLDDPLLLGFLDAVRSTGSDEIGGPVDPDGPGGKHFADDLHRDHVHLGFER